MRVKNATLVTQLSFRIAERTGPAYGQQAVGKYIIRSGNTLLLRSAIGNVWSFSIRTDKDEYSLASGSVTLVTQSKLQFYFYLRFPKTRRITGLYLLPDVQLCLSTSRLAMISVKTL